MGTWNAHFRYLKYVKTRWIRNRVDGSRETLYLLRNWWFDRISTCCWSYKTAHLWGMCRIPILLSIECSLIFWCIKYFVHSWFQFLHLSILKRTFLKGFRSFMTRKQARTKWMLFRASILCIFLNFIMMHYIYIMYIYIFKHWGVFIGFHDKKAYIAHTGTDFGDFGNSSINGSAESLATIRTKVSCSNQVQVHILWNIHIDITQFVIRLGSSN